jgi:hypothetical protein
MIKEGDSPLSAAVPSMTRPMAGSRITEMTNQIMAEIPKRINTALSRVAESRPDPVSAPCAAVSRSFWGEGRGLFCALIGNLTSLNRELRLG